jgi:hypothetical protein
MDRTLSEILAFSVMSIAIEQFVMFVVWLVAHVPSQNG